MALREPFLKALSVDLYPKTNINQVEGLKEKIKNLENFDTHLDLTKLTKPVNPTTNSVVTIADNGAVGTIPLNEIGGGKLYIHRVSLKSGLLKDYQYYITVPSSDATPITKETANRLFYGYLEEIDGEGIYHASTVKNVVAYESTNELSIDGTLPPMAIAAAIESDTVLER